MRVTLDGRLYSPAAVRETAEAFGELATIEVASSKGMIEVSVTDIDPDMGSSLVDEFLNYALASTISSRG